MSRDTLARLSPGQRLAAARARGAQIMPYFRSGLQSLVPVERKGMGTLGVTKHSHLLVDYETLGQWTADEAGAVLLHEYLHVFLNHSDRFEALMRAGACSVADAKDWNYAADAEINDNLIEAGCQLPNIDGDPITPASLNMPANRTAEEYFAELLKRKQEGDGGGAGQSQGPGGWGQCGSGAGNPLPDEPNQAQDGRDPMDQHVQRKQDSGAIQQAAKQSGSGRGRGTVPAGLARAADALLKPAEVPWQEKLGRAARNAVAHVMGHGDYTFTERNRMQHALDQMYGEDAPVLPGEWQPRAEVLFAVDTSGSIGDVQLHKVCSEADSVLRNLGGARMTFVSIDATIHTVARVKSVKELRAGLAGGGGTDFRPVFDLVGKLKPKPTIIIFATDGYGPAPEQPPPGVHTIWLIIDGQSPCTWGEHIHVHADAEEVAA